MMRSTTTAAGRARAADGFPGAQGANVPSRARAFGGKQAAWLLAAVVVLAVLAGASLAIGARGLSLGTVWQALTAFDPANGDHAVVHARFPRTVLGLLAGGALGLAGAAMQGVARNPLADPGIMGVNAGAALAVVTGIYVFGVGSLSGYIWFAFVGAGAAAVVVYLIASLGRDGATPVKLALAGAAGALIVLLTGRILNSLALGDDIARGLGQRVGLARAVTALGIVLLCGSATALAGPIGFVGLVIPHAVRFLTGPDYRWILPFSLVLAPVLLLGADIIGRVVLLPGEVPAGIMTALIGAPVFVWLIRHGKGAGL
jgi:iron complex transport system permease protein